MLLYKYLQIVINQLRRMEIDFQMLLSNNYCILSNFTFQCVDFYALYTFYVPLLNNSEMKSWFRLYMLKILK